MRDQNFSSLQVPKVLSNQFVNFSMSSCIFLGFKYSYIHEVQMLYINVYRILKQLHFLLYSVHIRTMSRNITHHYLRYWNNNFLRLLQLVFFLTLYFNASFSSYFFVCIVACLMSHTYISSLAMKYISVLYTNKKWFMCILFYFFLLPTLHLPSLIHLNVSTV